MSRPRESKRRRRISHRVRAFEVWVATHEEFGATINTTSAGRARYQFLLRLRDAGWQVEFKDLRVRSVGGPVSSRDFRRMAQGRGLSRVRCGDRVFLASGARGTIVGHTSSACFEVQFDADSPRYPGAVLAVHPGECQIETPSGEVAR